MKKKYLLAFFVLLTFFTTIVNAQMNDSDKHMSESIVKLRHELKSHFAESVLKNAPTGILGESGVQFVHLDQYNGKLKEDNFSDIANQYVIMTSLYDCKSYNFLKIPTPDEFCKKIDSKFESKREATPLSLIFYKYNTIKENAVAKKLIVSKNNVVQLGTSFRTADWQNIYDENILVSISPIKTIWDNTLTINLNLDKDLFFTNAKEEIKKITVRFEDGGDFVAPKEGKVSYTYSTYGIKHLIFRIYVSNTTYYESQTNILLRDNKNDNQSYQFGQGVISTDDYIDSQSLFSKSHSGGNIKIHYAKSNTEHKIKRPLIFVEGFDAEKFSTDAEGLSILNYFINDISNLNQLAILKPKDVSDFDYRFSEVDVRVVSIDTGIEVFHKKQSINSAIDLSRIPPGKYYAIIEVDGKSFKQIIEKK